MPRSYRSRVRAERAEETRQRIIDAAVGLLEEHDPSELTIARLAELAGVTPPTVYRYFPTTDDVLDALLPVTMKLLFGERAVITEPEVVFPNCEKHGRLTRTIVNSATWDRVRSKTQPQRNEGYLDELAARAPDLPRDEVRIYGGPAMAFASPYMWKLMRDVWGLDADEAVQAAKWARGVLLDALARRSNERRKNQQARQKR